VVDIEYIVINDRRVMVGLTLAETFEFERLDAEIPLNAKPVWPDTANSKAEERWLELYTKHQLAKLAPQRKFAGIRQAAGAAVWRPR
jgi:hypothetical protein